MLLLCPWIGVVNWHCCLLSHGWLPGLSIVGMRDPWAACLGQLPHRSLEQVLGAYPADASDSGPHRISGMLMIWLRVLEDHPSLWTDGSWEDYPVGGFEVAGAGVFLPAPEEAMRGAVWGTTEEYGDARLERCRVFMPVPSPLQTVQHAELWGAILAVQAFWPGHLGIDDLNVVRSIGRLLDQGAVTKPLPLFDDGD